MGGRPRLFDRTERNSPDVGVSEIDRLIDIGYPIQDEAITMRSIRVFNVIDDFNREALGIEVDFSLPCERVIRMLKQIIGWRGKPSAIRCDNGPEYLSAAIVAWAEAWGIKLEYIQPGKPQQNAHVERFNLAIRYEWLSQYHWDDLDHVQRVATQWMWSLQSRARKYGSGRIYPKTAVCHDRVAFPLLAIAKKGGLPWSLSPGGEYPITCAIQLRSASYRARRSSNRFWPKSFGHMDSLPPPLSVKRFVSTLMGTWPKS
ncbi:hypothetical protein DDE05_59760 [Streptomyces cavourensis]|nr:hypothetical protein DDE05_59760 [Streptomyces cavourensis]